MLNRKIAWVPEIDCGDAVVWIDVAKLDRLWQASSGYVGAGGVGQETIARPRYVKFGERLRRRTGPVHMPHLSVGRHGIDFVNGRHRFAWLRDHGALALPVTTDPQNSGQLRREIGSRRRLSVLTKAWWSSQNRVARLAVALDHPPRGPRGPLAPWRFATWDPPRAGPPLEAIDPASIVGWAVDFSEDDDA